MQVRVERIEAFGSCYRWGGYFKFLEGSPGHTVVFVKATGDDGRVGWGQSLPVPRWSYETPETVLAAIRKYLAPAVVGIDPLQPEAAAGAMDRALAPGFTTGMPLARAGIDIALHDLAGKATGRSLAELWGKPSGGNVPLSWTINVRSLDDVDAEVTAGLRRGYRSFNIKIAPDPWFDLEVVRRVRRLSPAGFLWADANGGYDLETALGVAPKLADAGVEVLESPLRPNRIGDYQRLRRQGAVPIAMDEGVISPVEAEEFIRLGMVDGLTIKVSRAGGLLSARRQIELALDAGLFWLGSGLTDPDLSLAASLALFAAYGLDKPAALNGPQYLQETVLKPPLEIVDGVAEIPRGPGLGVEVEEGQLAQLCRRWTDRE